MKEQLYCTSVLKVTTLLSVTTAIRSLDPPSLAITYYPPNHCAIPLLAQYVRPVKTVYASHTIPSAISPRTLLKTIVWPAHSHVAAIVTAASLKILL